MQDKKQQLELKMEQWTGSKLRKEYVKDISEKKKKKEYVKALQYHSAI